MQKPIVLQADLLVKRYGGVEVVRHVSFPIRAGEVLGLVGENGAGKSTMVGMFSGAVSPDGGDIVIDGERHRSLSPSLARRLGIGAVRQEPVLVPTLSVAENMLLGREPQRAGLVQRRQARAMAQAWLTDVGAQLSPDTLVEDLLPADRQFLEIARVVGGGARVVFLDEPTAVLGPGETQQLFNVIRRLTAAGTAVVYVSHRLEEIFDICERVVVLRDGNLVADMAVSDLDEDRLVALIAGRELAADEAIRQQHPIGGMAPALALQNVSNGGRLRDVTFEVYAGEIHGIFGIVGSSRSRLARLIAGLERLDQGTMTLNGKPYHPRSPRHAIDAGVILVPEDRHRSALFPELDLASNVLIGSHGQYSRSGFTSRGQEARVAMPLMERLDVRPLDPTRLGRTLSGGNQQKLILARALGKHPTVLVLDEPTRGVDVGAKVDIHEFIRQQTGAGVAALVVSSDLRELLALADRITVLARGRVVETFAGEFDRERLIAAATAGR